MWYGEKGSIKKENRNSFRELRLFGGSGGIRTHGTVRYN